jgi:hypothetical protein
MRSSGEGGDMGRRDFEPELERDLVVLVADEWVEDKVLVLAPTEV